MWVISVDCQNQLVRTREVQWTDADFQEARNQQWNRIPPRLPAPPGIPPADPPHIGPEPLLLLYTASLQQAQQLGAELLQHLPQLSWPPTPENMQGVIAAMQAAREKLYGQSS